ncbi:unnamed protein product [Brachionus calyciflorus]|uniref:Uncharacterized protein n=1 Tax=Brachionus calyciflorus TaxID=104777 RepID=A0A813MBB3_9BILA|nr:unnamed protein product [Brachionus calyciflorus]
MKVLPLLFIVVFVQSAYSATLTCSSSCTTATPKYYCLAVDNTSTTSCAQCAAGVKYWCPTNPLLSTRSWVKGIKVLDNCASIPKYTAIATFPTGSYSGHAAVFISCSGNTIKVYDQYVDKMWSPRDIWNTAGTLVNNPNNYYTINY